MKLLPNFEDERGSITDILTHCNIDAVTVISSAPGTVRANHFHKETTQWTYVIEGEIEYHFQKPGSKSQEMQVLTPGSLACSEPWVAHAMKSTSQSQMLILTKGPRSGEDYEKDTFRLEIDLV